MLNRITEYTTWLVVAQAHEIKSFNKIGTDEIIRYERVSDNDV